MFTISFIGFSSDIYNISAMLSQNYQKFLTTTKFQKAAIIATNQSNLFVIVGTKNQSSAVDAGELDDFYQYNTYALNQSLELHRMLEFRLIDIKHWENKQNKHEAVIFKGKKKFQYTKILSKYSTSSIDIELAQGKIISQKQSIIVSSSMKRLQLLDLQHNQNNILKQAHSKKSKIITKKTGSTIYDLQQINRNGSISTLHLLSQDRALFHIGLGLDGYFNNYELKCMDIEYQQVQWQELQFHYNFMLNKILKIKETAFLNGSVDRQYNTSLKLYDLRAKGAMLNALHSEDQIFSRLGQQWRGSGTLQAEFDLISKYSQEYKIMGMLSFCASKYSFPFLLDLRKPHQILPFNYPHGPPLSHLKCFEVSSDNLFAVQRQYSNFSFKSAKLSSFLIEECS